MAASTPQVITFSGTMTVGGTKYTGVTGSFTLPAQSPPAPTPTPVPVPVPVPSSSQCYFGVWDDGSGYPADGVTFCSGRRAEVPRRPRCWSATYYLAWLGPFPVGLNVRPRPTVRACTWNLEPQNTWGGGVNPNDGGYRGGQV